MSKLFTILKNGIAILAFATAFLVLLFFIVMWLFFRPNNSHYEKPSAIAGFKEGSLFDVHLLLYPDSTYYYSNTKQKGNWGQSSDTLVLSKHDSVQAILVNYQPVKINVPIYNWLKDMKFKEFNPPKVVKFPVHGQFKMKTD